MGFNFLPAGGLVHETTLKLDHLGGGGGGGGGGRGDGVDFLLHYPRPET